MIYSVLVNYEADDLEAAERVAMAIATLVDRELELVANVSAPAEVRPLAVLPEDVED